MRLSSSSHVVCFILLLISGTVKILEAQNDNSSSSTTTTTTTTTAAPAPLQVSTTQSSAPQPEPTQRTRKVTIPPLITLEPVLNVAFRRGESIELPCAASGQPTPTYSWVWNDKAYDPSGMDGRVAIQPGVGTLIFADPEPLDEAIYQCNATNIVGTALTVKINLRQAILEPFQTTGVKTNYPNLGDSLQLKCLPPRSFPPAEVYWVTISEGSQFTPIDYTDRVTQDPIGNLNIVNVVNDDYKNNRTYACIAQNKAMRSIQQGEYNRIRPAGVNAVYHAPDIMWQSPTQQLALRGQSLSIKCIFSGNPTPRVSWTRAEPPNLVFPNTTVIDSFGQQLTINNIQYADAGKYECQGINDEGMVPVRRSFTVAVESSPYWVNKPTSIDTSENETSVFTCYGEGIPDPNYFWSINGVPITKLPDDPRRVTTKNTLTFTNMTVKDAMVIQCNISNKYGYNFTNAYLNVLVEPPLILDAPVVGQKAAEGQTTELICNVYGSPKPQVVWVKSGEQLTGGRFTVMPNGNLQITDVSLVDAGTYTCTATNSLGSAEASGFLIVRRRTMIVTKPQDMMVYTLKEAKFTCTATTDPEEVTNLQIQWQKDNQTIDYTLAQRVFQNQIDNSLTISGTIYLDTGTFTCVALNGLDSDSATAQLIVQAPPDPPSSVQVRCYNTNNQAEIWWQPGKENYAPILNFIVQYNTTFAPDTWYDIATNLSQNERRIVVSMSPWGNYTFRVIARNKIGLSLPSMQTFNICMTQPNVPNKNPENVMGEGDTPGNLVIFWTPMPKIEQNGPDFKYIVSWKVADDPNAPTSTIMVGTTDAWNYIVPGDRPYAPYQKFLISVKASNAKGDSKANLVWVTGYSGEDIPKVTPADVTYIDSTLMPTSVNLTWTEVDTSPSQIVGMFRGYRAEYGDAATYPANLRTQDFILYEAVIYPRPRIMKRAAPVVRSFQITNVPPNTRVKAVVRVLNKYYAGPISNVVDFTTPEGVPGPPETLNIAVIGATHFVITWTPPKELNGALTGFNITYQTITGLNLGRLQYYDAPIDAGTTQARVTGLNPNTTYRIYLAASTSAGKGDPIFIDEATSLSGPPDPPTFAVTDMNETFANVSWEPSRSGVPGSVFYVQYKPRVHYDWLRSPDEFMDNFMALMSLDPGTTYQVRVVAKNGNGFEAPSVYLEFHTPGVAPGDFDLKTSGWFYGIWICLFLIIVGLVLLLYLKTHTDRRWEEKEAEIEEEMRRLQAEEAARQMGVFNQYVDSGSREMVNEELKMPLRGDNADYGDAYDNDYPMKYGGPSAAQQDPRGDFSGYSGGFRNSSPGAEKKSKPDTFV